MKTVAKWALLTVLVAMCIPAYAAEVDKGRAGPAGKPPGDRTDQTIPPMLQKDLNAKAPGGTFKGVYNTHPSGDLPLQVDLPKGEGPFPVVIYLHGGGLGKTPGQFKAYSLHMAALGVAGVRILYRSTEPGTYDDIMVTLMNAMTYVRANAGRFHFDMKRMAWAGGSLGAVLGGTVAQHTPECIAFVGFNGVYDLARHLERFGGAETIKESPFYGKLTPERLKEVSAIYQIRTPPPATLLLHGTADTTVDAEQSLRFAEALKAKGGRVVLRLYEGENHGFFNSGRYDETVKDMETFLLDVFGLARTK